MKKANHLIQKKAEVINPLTTIVMPSFNAEELLPRAIVSALTQETDYPYEVIIVDDGSHRPIKSSLEESLLDDPKISLVRQSNKGISSAMNLGTKLSRGNYIVLLDSDDEILPQAIQDITDEFVGNSNLGYVYTDGFWIGLLQGWNWENFCPEKLDKNSYVNPWVKRDFDYQLLLYEMYLGHARAYTKDVFEIVGGFDDRYSCKAEDWDFALKVSEKKDIKRIPKKLHKYHLQSSGITSTSKSEEVFMVQQKILLDVMYRRGLNLSDLPDNVVKKYKLK